MSFYDKVARNNVIQKWRCVETEKRAKKAAQEDWSHHHHCPPKLVLMPPSLQGHKDSQKSILANILVSGAT